MPPLLRRSLPILAASVLAMACADSGPAGPEMQDEIGPAALSTSSGELPGRSATAARPPWVTEKLFEKAIAEGSEEGLAFLVEGEPPASPLVAEIIGPEGGRIALGAFEIEVPAGAVAGPTLFMIRLPRDQEARSWVIAELRPHDVTFMEPVTLRMSLDGTSAEGVPADIRTWERQGWESVPTHPIDAGHRIEASVDHFSLWGVFLRGELTSGGLR